VIGVGVVGTGGAPVVVVVVVEPLELTVVVVVVVGVVPPVGVVVAGIIDEVVGINGMRGVFMPVCTVGVVSTGIPAFDKPSVVFVLPGLRICEDIYYSVKGGRPSGIG
jgi:hypothetical protein